MASYEHETKHFKKNAIIPHIKQTPTMPNSYDVAETGRPILEHFRKLLVLRPHLRCANAKDPERTQRNHNNAILPLILTKRKKQRANNHVANKDRGCN